MSEIPLAKGTQRSSRRARQANCSLLSTHRKSLFAAHASSSAAAAPDGETAPCVPLSTTAVTAIATPLLSQLALQSPTSTERSHRDDADDHEDPRDLIVARLVHQSSAVESVPPSRNSHPYSRRSHFRQLGLDRASLAFCPTAAAVAVQNCSHCNSSSSSSRGPSAAAGETKTRVQRYRTVRRVATMTPAPTAGGSGDDETRNEMTMPAVVSPMIVSPSASSTASLPYPSYDSGCIWPLSLFPQQEGKQQPPLEQYHRHQLTEAEASVNDSPSWRVYRKSVGRPEDGSSTASTDPKTELQRGRGSCSSFSGEGSSPPMSGSLEKCLPAMTPVEQHDRQQNQPKQGRCAGAPSSFPASSIPEGCSKSGAKPYKAMESAEWLEKLNKFDGFWTLEPRRCGVNRAVFTAAGLRQARWPATTPLAVEAIPLSFFPSENPDMGKDEAVASVSALQHRRRASLDEVSDAVAAVEVPVLLELHGNSAGGTYMVRRLVANQETLEPMRQAFICAVFKPCDEEIGQRGNPHGNHQSDRTLFFAPGSGSRREVLAYCLDHGGFAHVPPTLEVVSSYHSSAPDGQGAATASSTATAPRRSSQVGSLQLCVQGCREAADLLPGRFSTEDVHALAIFDIRTLNGDRHGGNVLVQTESPPALSPSSPGSLDCSAWVAAEDAAAQSYALVPIDHSYICPCGYNDPDYEWLSWPQSKKPFSMRSLRYIASLDPEADAALVESVLLAPLQSTEDVASPLSGGATAVANAAYTALSCSHSNLSGGGGGGGLDHGSCSTGCCLETSASLSRDLNSISFAACCPASLFGREGFQAAERPNGGPMAPCGSPDGLPAPAIQPKTRRHRSAKKDTPSRWLCAADSDVALDREAAHAAADVMRCTTRLLQIAALEFELTAFDIGGLCRRPRLTSPSMLELVMEAARDEQTWRVDSAKFDAIIRRRLGVQGERL